VVAMTRTSSILRIALDAGIIGRGHVKIAERGHIPWLSLIIGMFASTLCIIKVSKPFHTRHVVAHVVLGGLLLRFGP
jgi:hypothetical protein